MTDMDCDVCSREFNTRRKPLCPSCAQAILYQGRIQQATALLDREKSHTHAEAVIRPGNDGVLAALPDDADFDVITGGIKKYSTNRTQADTKATLYRVDRIVQKAEELKRQIEEYKATAAAQKETIERRRNELKTEYTELEKHKPRALDPVLAATKKASQRLEKAHNKIADARSLLCREAAAAINFQRRKGINGRSEYILGGIVIPDLRELNIKTQPLAKPTVVGGRIVREPHELVSEAMDNVARLTSICAHYLSLRLPAETILPHEDFPRAVVMPEKSSYKVKNVPFPGISNSQASSPAASRIVERNLPRPRNLWLNGPLAQLCKDDQKSFNMYVEGVMLLGWNVAWLCRSQGLDISNFEDVCNVGRNLWQLSMTQHHGSQRPGLDRRTTSTSTKGGQTKHTRIGLFSHNSVRHNMAAAEGLDFMRGWNFATSTSLIDRLKNSLQAEISGAEWDLLEEQEWDEEREDERPVLVGGSRRPQESRYAAMSIMTVAPHDGTGDEKSGAESKKKSGSGWMKVRGRNEDA